MSNEIIKYGIHFDCSLSFLTLSTGETIKFSISEVQDLKSVFTGLLMITNLRIIWKTLQQSNSISISLDTISSITTDNHILFLTALDSQEERYEFSFTAPQIPEFLVRTKLVLAAFRETRIYRDLFVRTSEIFNSESTIRVLDNEVLVKTIQGVCNISSDQGNIGYLVVSTHRIIWVAFSDQYFNVSIPYLITEKITVQKSKYGLALCVCTAGPRKLRLGFNINPEALLMEVAKLAKTMFKAALKSPCFGIVHDRPNARMDDGLEEDLDVFDGFGIDSSLCLAVDRKSIRYNTNTSVFLDIIDI